MKHTTWLFSCLTFWHQSCWLADSLFWEQGVSFWTTMHRNSIQRSLESIVWSYLAGRVVKWKEEAFILFSKNSICYQIPCKSDCLSLLVLHSSPPPPTPNLTWLCRILSLHMLSTQLIYPLWNQNIFTVVYLNTICKIGIIFCIILQNNWADFAAFCFYLL